jgi:hypothetical protein
MATSLRSRFSVLKSRGTGSEDSFRSPFRFHRTLTLFKNRSKNIFRVAAQSVSAPTSANCNHFRRRRVPLPAATSCRTDFLGGPASLATLGTTTRSSRS